MLLFEEITPESKDYVILSASRMTDMPAFYPKDIILEVEKRLTNGVKVHTLILWTKHPATILIEPLYSFLKKLKQNGIQLYVHITITGLGKKELGTTKQNKLFIPEPNVPLMEEAISALDGIITLIGKAERMRIRIDPIMRIQDFNGSTYSNISLLDPIIIKCKNKGITKFNFSLLEKGVYKKVDKRFEKMGIEIIPLNIEEKTNLKEYMQKLETNLSINIFACAVSDFPKSKCVDGIELSELHDKKLPSDHKMPRTRKLCACTKSIDLGGWPVKTCYSGCVYCYANPAIQNR